MWHVLAGFDTNREPLPMSGPRSVDARFCPATKIDDSRASNHEDQENRKHPKTLGEELSVTEEEWLESAEPTPMLKFLAGKASIRKMRLFAANCCYRIWSQLSDERLRTAALTAASSADGWATETELEEARATARQLANTSADAFRRAIIVGGWGNQAESEAAMAVAHCTESNVTEIGKTAQRASAAVAFSEGERNRIKATNHGILEEGVDDVIRHSATPDELARFREQQEQCHLLREIFGNPFRPINIDARWLDSEVVDWANLIYDHMAFGRMVHLGRALKKAGCMEEAVLAHCRCGCSHVRGCWLIDRLLDRS
jgi:hypothetical protein